MFDLVPAKLKDATGAMKFPVVMTADEEKAGLEWMRQVALRKMYELYVPADDSPEELALADKTYYEVMWIRARALATGANPARWAVEFIQEHKVGKAVQRIQQQTVHMSYQDLLQKIDAAETRYQEAVVVTVEAASVPKTFADLL